MTGRTRILGSDPSQQPVVAPSCTTAIIVGTGPAGLSASIYLARFNRTVLVIDDGQGRSTGHQENENYLGFPRGTHARELRMRGCKQAKRFGAEFAEGCVGGDYAGQAAIMDDYAVTTGGAFLTTAANGTGTASAIAAIAAACGDPITPTPPPSVGGIAEVIDANDVPEASMNATDDRGLVMWLAVTTFLVVTGGVMGLTITRRFGAPMTSSPVTRG